jgi:DNA-3-methyladenine glycosylase II
MSDLISSYRILRKDPVLKKVIAVTGRFDVPGRNELYVSMLRSVASQQLSARAGDTIFDRFLDLYPSRKPLPELVLKTKVEKLRECGLSYAKAGYMQNIAKFKTDGGLEHRKLNRMEDDALITHLTQIKGVGKWTAEMILMFTLNRPDILPLDDVGIQNAVKHLYKINHSGKQLREAMEEISQSWRPHRTLACRHLWRYMDGGNDK